jgi:glucose-1-phosphate cytidylyltransferase
VDLKNNSIKFENTTAEPWNIRLLDTGSDTMTGGRIKRAFRYTDNEAFMLTYGDGVADINLDALLSFHKRQKTYATVTAVQPTGRFGSLSVDPASNRTSFVEKPPGDNAWINGGFFVVEPEAVDFIQGDDIVWERDPLEKISRINELSAYKHSGFWHPMDTLRDKKYLNELWNSGNPPWRVWNE